MPTSREFKTLEGKIFQAFSTLRDSLSYDKPRKLLTDEEINEIKRISNYARDLSDKLEILYKRAYEAELIAEGRCRGVGGHAGCADCT